MSNTPSRDLVPGMIGKLNIITRGLMARDSRPSSPAQIGFRRWWLITAATWAILTSGGVAIAETTANPNYTGAMSKSISCVARYRNIAWSAPIPASDLGKSLATSQFYRAWNPQAGTGQDHIDIARAPDGSLSMRVRFTPVYGYYGFKGKTFEARPLQTACFSFKMWIANDYWAGYRANERGHLTHKMPRVWGGPRWYHPACSRRSEALAAGSGFTVAASMHNDGRMGLYYYDYSNLTIDNCGTGSQWGGAPQPTTGRWHQYDLEVVINNNGSRTGIARLYANGAFGTEYVTAVWEPVGKTWGVMGPAVETGNAQIPDRVDTMTMFELRQIQEGLSELAIRADPDHGPVWCMVKHVERPCFMLPCSIRSGRCRRVWRA
jgi:hypothetical protein